MPVLHNTRDGIVRVGCFQNLVSSFKSPADSFPVSGIFIYHQNPGHVSFIPYFILCFPPSRSFVPRRLNFQQFFIFRDGHGFCKKIALNIIAAEPPQPFQLLPGLHTLCHHAQSHPVGKADDESQNALIRRFFHLILDKFHIQLQNVQPHLIQHVQR